MHNRILCANFLCLLLLFGAGSGLKAQSQLPAKPVVDHPVENGFAIIKDGVPVPIWVSDMDFPGVIRVAGIYKET